MSAATDHLRRLLGTARCFGVHPSTGGGWAWNVEFTSDAPNSISGMGARLADAFTALLDGADKVQEYDKERRSIARNYERSRNTVRHLGERIEAQKRKLHRAGQQVTSLREYRNDLLQQQAALLAVAEAAHNARAAHAACHIAPDEGNQSAYDHAALCDLRLDAKLAALDAARPQDTTSASAPPPADAQDAPAGVTVTLTPDQARCYASYARAGAALLPKADDPQVMVLADEAATIIEAAIEEATQ